MKIKKQMEEKMKKIKIVLMVVVVFICLAVIIHGQGSKLDEGMVGQVTKTAGKNDMPINEQREINNTNNTNNTNIAIDTKANTNIVKKKGRKIEQTDKELRFLDEEGKIVKKINIESQMELIKKIKKEEKEYKTYKNINYISDISDDENYAGLFISQWDSSSTSMESVLEITGQKYIFKYIDKNGEVLWEKGNIVPAPSRHNIISSNGKRILLVEGEPTKEYINPTRIILVNEKGEEIWSYKFLEWIPSIDFIYISKNGRYGCCGYSNKNFKILFFDIDNKKIHEADGIFATFCEITDDGVGRAYKSEYKRKDKFSEYIEERKLIYEYKFK